MEIAPLFGLILGSLSAIPHDRVQANDCAAKASLSSIMSISFQVSPAFFKARLAASTGPIPIIRGSTPTAPEETMRAIGLRLYFFTATSAASNKAQAPSFNPEELPAVTDPSFLNAGFNFAR